jgi:hypothetical protein
MTKDGPPSGRMGFGFRQAQAAGAPYRAPRSAAEVNLEAFLKRHPELKARVEKMREAKTRPSSILEELREEGWDGRFALGLWRDAEQEQFLGYRYEHERATLEEHADWGSAQGIYRAAILYEMPVETDEWQQVRAWPEGLVDRTEDDWE